MVNLEADDKPLKVLHIGPTPFFSDRGCHIRIRGLVRGLQQQDVECWLCTYGLGNEVPDVETERVASIPGYRRLDAGPSVFKYVADVLLLAKVCGSIMRRNPDVLHGHLHEGALIGHAARTLLFWKRLPLVFDMQGSLTGELDQYGYFKWLPPVRWLFHAAEWMIDRLPDRIAASSRSSLEIAQGQFGIAPQRLTLVEDGADVTPADPQAVAQLRAELEIPDDRFVVVYTGTLKKVKGLPELLDVIQKTVAQDGGVHFVLVGYPVEEAAAFLREHDLESRCTLAGRVAFDRVNEYLALGDIALEPKSAGTGEASGKLLNYMAAGLPVVCFDTPNNRAMLHDSGCYASPGRTDELVDAIAKLAADPERARQLGTHGQARVSSEFSWDSSAETLLHVYYDCIGDY